LKISSSLFLARIDPWFDEYVKTISHSSGKFIYALGNFKSVFTLLSLPIFCISIHSVTFLNFFLEEKKFSFFLFISSLTNAGVTLNLSLIFLISLYFSKERPRKYIKKG